MTVQTEESFILIQNCSSLAKDISFVINKGKLATGFLVEYKVLKDKLRNEE